ncbi:hypothetical protein SNR37_002088 [Agarivorans aestuarii]|uniref:VanZ-like domain-containing protein n=1 Tax=Agarivorans aestuarii TaxID=1563703 RepID=A0ABU7FZT5_9ALTE|nr:MULTISPECIES: hypothetical protein [Agarivorans]MEE1672678.1 hypothetical protein [Agarivorans aestuarii]
MSLVPIPKQRYWRIACCIVALLLLLASGLKSLGNNRVFFVELEILLGGDSVVHFAAAFIVSTLVMMAVSDKLYRLKLVKLPLIFVMLCLVFAVDEGLQLLSAHRQFSWGDLGFNYAGLICAGVLVWRLRRANVWQVAGEENVH